MEISAVNSLNSLLTKVYSSIEPKIYKIADEILYINKDIMKIKPIAYIKFEKSNNTIYLLISSFVIFFSISYIINSFCSIYSSQKRVSSVLYYLRIIFCAILSTSSFYIISEIININSLFSNVIREIGKEICGQEILFENLKDVFTNNSEILSGDFVSLEGVLKTLLSFSIITIVINLSLRYAYIVFLIIVSPISLMLYSSSFTENVFYMWFKMFISQILSEHIISLILIIPLSIKTKDSNVLKILVIGSIYLLQKFTTVTDTLFSKISRGRNV